MTSKIGQLVLRFVPPYKRLMGLNLLFNLVSTVLSLFSFAAIIPMLKILFGLDKATVHYESIETAESVEQWFVILKNNMYCWLSMQIEQHGASTVLLMLGVFLVAMTALKCLTAWLANYFLVPVRTGVLRDVRRSLYDHIVGLPVAYFTHERRGDVISRMTNDVNEVEASIMASLDILFKDPVMILIYVVTLFVISWQLTLFVVVLLPIVGLLIGRIGRSLKHQSRHGQEQNADILSQVDETLGGMRVVKAFNAEDKLRARFHLLIDDTRRTFNRIYRRYYLAHPVSELLGTALIALVLWFGGMLILREDTAVDAATFIYYLVIFYSIIGPAKDLSKASYGVRRGIASLERIDAILSAKSTITDPACPKTIDGLKHEIVYHDVCFSYTPGVPVLRHVSLSIQRGQKVALVGQSGSGKTTITDLLPRFYDPDSGQVTLDGTNIRDCAVSDLRSLMGIVNQDAILFNDTFYNNITFGVDTSKPAPNNMSWQEAVEQAARIANAHEFIMATQDGYQTVVGERGNCLSGGQRQRISIARAILKNPPILILDEATSALDSESELLVQQALERLMCDRTTLVVAHRLSTIRNADLICVVHEGQIVEKGTHEELYAQGGYYTKLVDMQGGI